MALKTFLELKGDLVLVEPFKPTDEHEKHKSGLFLPTSDHEKRVRQVVLSVGPEVTDLAIGTEVCVGKHAGIAVDVGGRELKIVEYKEILGIFITEVS